MLSVGSQDLLDHLSPSPRPPDPVLVRRTLAAGVAASVVAMGLALWARPTRGQTDAPVEAPPAVAVDPDLARVATARLPLVDVFDSPTGDGVLTTLEHPTPAGGDLVFLVSAAWDGWYKVLVPAPPAGTVGWVRASDVDVDEHRVRITLDLDDHLLTVREDGRVALRAPVAIGMHDRPGPGLTYVTGRVALANRHGAYGALALPLAGYGNGAETLFRGQGLVALHATGDALDVGQTVPDGSVGLAADDMRLLAELVPVGTPVHVVSTGTPPA